VPQYPIAGDANVYISNSQESLANAKVSARQPSFARQKRILT